MNKQCLSMLSLLSRSQKQRICSLKSLRLSLEAKTIYHNFSIPKFEDVKFLAAVKLTSMIQQRSMNTSSDNDGNRKKPPTPLMNFEPVMRPEILLSLKNWILAKFIIQPYLDRDFTLKDFTNGAKQAIGIVSSFLSQGDFQSLKGLITDDAIVEIKKNFSSLNVKERQDLLIKITDMLFAFPYQIGIIFDDSNQKRFAEITVVCHSMNDFEEIKAQGKMITESSKDDVKICNYRFIREYTKGVKSEWTINRLGHFKLCHFEK